MDKRLGLVVPATLMTVNYIVTDMQDTKRFSQEAYSSLHIGTLPIVPTDIVEFMSSASSSSFTINASSAISFKSS